MKKTIFTLLQTALTVSLLYYVFRDEQTRRQIVETLPQLDISWFFAGWLAFSILIVTGIYRWKILLHVQGIELSTARTGSLFLIGFFFNNFLPGSTGGDLFKIYYVMKEAHLKKPAAFLSVLVDRIIGLLALMILSTVLIVWRYEWLTQDLGELSMAWFWEKFWAFEWDLLWQETGTLFLVYSLIFILAVCLVFVVVSYIVSALGWVQKIPARFPLRELWVELADAYKIYGHAWPRTLMALGLGIVGHLGIFLSFFLGARAYSSEIGMIEFFTTLPIVNTITSLPITISGLGAREEMFKELLGSLCGIPPETAILVSLTCWMIALGWGLVGGIVYLFYRSSLQEMRHEIEEIEEGETP